MRYNRYIDGRKERSPKDLENDMSTTFAAEADFASFRRGLLRKGRAIVVSAPVEGGYLVTHRARRAAA